MNTAIVEAAITRDGERIALGIMNIVQALALPYDDLEFTNPHQETGAAPKEAPPFLMRDEFIRLLERP
ncbi:hypothetical protein ACQKKX_04375 [Neorhizobium sp. NPDC001467]|uniref:hypothetical protein n=1 Tax=Neorhizobium sp. NPDC001467 TaxID=3390595 RepID=UPI003D03D78B